MIDFERALVTLADAQVRFVIVVGDLDLLGEVTGIGDYAAVLAASEPVELFD